MLIPKQHFEEKKCFSLNLPFCPLGLWMMEMGTGEIIFFINSRKPGFEVWNLNTLWNCFCSSYLMTKMDYFYAKIWIRSFLGQQIFAMNIHIMKLEDCCSLYIFQFSVFLSSFPVKTENALQALFNVFLLWMIWAAWPYMLSMSLIRCKNEALKKKYTSKWEKKKKTGFTN